MAVQLCSNPWRNNFVEGKIWDHPWKTTQEWPKFLFFSFTITLDSQHARVNTDFYSHNTFFEKIWHRVLQSASFIVSQVHFTVTTRSRFCYYLVITKTSLPNSSFPYEIWVCEGVIQRVLRMTTKFVGFENSHWETANFRYWKLVFWGFSTNHSKFGIWFELDSQIETGSDNVIARRRGCLGEFTHSRDYLSCSQYPARESLWTCFRTWV